MISLVKNNFICEKLTTQKIKKINKLKKTTKITNNESAGGTDGGITPAESRH